MLLPVGVWFLSISILGHLGCTIVAGIVVRKRISVFGFVATSGICPPHLFALHLYLLCTRATNIRPGSGKPATFLGKDSRSVIFYSLDGRNMQSLLFVSLYPPTIWLLNVQKKIGKTALKIAKTS